MKKKAIGYIYKITAPNGRIYIGQKRSPVFDEKYWSSSHNPEYWNDLEKYGKDAFKREIVEWCYTIDELNTRETYWITNTNALKAKGGYNIVASFHNILQTPEVKAKLLKSITEYWKDPENHKKHSKAMHDSKAYKESRKTVGKALSESNLKFNQNIDAKNKRYAFTKTKEYKEKAAQKASNSKWYTDGVNNIFIASDDIPPANYKPGMTIKEHKPLTMQHRKTLSEVQKGKHWYTNGIKNIRSESCPEGYHLGRVVIIAERKQWWNNGKSNKKSIECPGPEWKKGKLNTFDLDISTEELINLYNTNTIYKLAKKFNTTISKIKGLLKRRNIIH